MGVGIYENGNGSIGYSNWLRCDLSYFRNMGDKIGNWGR